MREILFRGFTPDENGRETITVNGKQIKGEWVQGSYLELRETTYCFQSDYDRHPDNTKHYIVFDRMTDWGLPNRHLQADVIPETVGQFTGLTDKNGKMIFEGDILDYWSSYNESLCESYEVVVFGVDNCSCCHAVYGWSTKNKYGYGRYIDTPENCVVVGNIHDTPELLKGA